MSTMQVGDKGKQLFKLWEGLRTEWYYDSGGEPTIGIGHLLTQSERSSGKLTISSVTVRYKDGISEQQCWDLLVQDLIPIEKLINQLVNVELLQNQFDALISFTFNVGESAFKTSTLLKVLNKGMYDSVPEQLMRWVYDNGNLVQGLVNRRNKEVGLWNEKSSRQTN